MLSGIRQTQENRTLCHIYVGSLKKSISQKSHEGREGGVQIEEWTLEKGESMRFWQALSHRVNISNSEKLNNFKV